MIKYLVCLKSVLALIWCKVFYRKKLSVGGIPVSVGISNIKSYLGGGIYVGRRLNLYGNTELVSLEGGKLKIGNAVYFNRNCNVVCRHAIEIGDECRFGPNVSVYDHDHHYSKDGVTDEFKLGSVKIGNNCWFGANAVILRDSIIGEGCVIGAGVVFKGELPPHSIVYYDKKNLIIKKIDNNDNSSNNNVSTPGRYC